jgi:DNA-binding transcriptional LysR family regulator
MPAFVAVARAGGFSAASRELGIPLATLSRRVADLETALRAQLLQRSTRRVVLTEAGESFYAACQRLLDDLRDAEESVTGEYRTPKGELIVTAPVGFGRLHLQPVALDFLAAYPEIRLRLLLADRVVNLIEEEVDVALRIAELPDSALVAKPLGGVRMVVCGSPTYLARFGMPAHPKDLLRHDCIAWSALSPNDGWWFREAGIDRTYSIRTRLSTTLPESALAAAQAGLGLVQTTCYQADPAVREGRLVRVLTEFECDPTPVSLVFAGSRLLPLKIRAFIDFAAPRLAERLREIGTRFSRDAVLAK